MTEMQTYSNGGLVAAASEHSETRLYRLFPINKLPLQTIESVPLNDKTLK